MASFKSAAVAAALLGLLWLLCVQSNAALAPTEQVGMHASNRSKPSNVNAVADSQSLSESALKLPVNSTKPAEPLPTPNRFIGYIEDALDTFSKLPKLAADIPKYVKEYVNNGVDLSLRMYRELLNVLGRKDKAVDKAIAEGIDVFARK